MMKTQIQNTARRALTVAALFGASIFSSCSSEGDDPKPVDPDPKPTELKNGDKLEYKQVRLGEDMTFRGQFYDVVADLADGRMLGMGVGGGSVKVVAKEQASLVGKQDIVEEKEYALTFKADQADVFEVAIRDGVTIYLMPKKDGTSTIKYRDNYIPTGLTDENKEALVEHLNGMVKDVLPSQKFSYRLEQ